MVTTNPGTVVELHHSSDGHFQQLFVAHAVSIQGFAMGCRPIIAIDSSHMSGPYGSALFSTTTYDVNDSMFPLAFGVMSVPEVFDLENHVYYYRHLKENFSGFVSKKNTKGNKGKENTFQFLDSIAYARVCIGRAFLNVDIMKRTCTCRGWQMFEIPYEHATAIILSIGHNVVDDYYKFPMQELIYASSFSSIETHDMSIVDDHGVVRSITGQVFFSLKPPHTKHPPGRPRKQCIESQFQDKQTVHCSRCHMSDHIRKTCKNPLS
ncbi:hypothetical protein CK203_027393 [Vitis vinifera]|uniref:SWIM-type domain-containing protein n=1 Tax=Vitis vinifera TaxID=29760 RepID=A0A438J9P6_VITVI|nr:hypothetical protein CK203_027393 [Vitis vinifera]